MHQRVKKTNSPAGGRAPHLVVVLVQHDDNLGHVVEFRDGAEVIHGTLPLLVLLLLPHQTHTESPPLTLTEDSQESGIAEYFPAGLTSSRPP